MKKGTVFSGVLALLAILYAAVAFSLVGGVRVYLFATKWGGLFIISRWYALLAAIVLWIVTICLLVRGMKKASGKKTEKKAEKKTKISVRKPQQELIQPAKPEEAPAALEKTVSEGLTEDLTEVTETVAAFEADREHALEKSEKKVSEETEVVKPEKEVQSEKAIKTEKAAESGKTAEAENAVNNGKAAETEKAIDTKKVDEAKEKFTAQEAKPDEAKRQSEQREPSEQNLCPKCGAVYKEGQRFCKKCGANLLSKGEEGK